MNKELLLKEIYDICDKNKCSGYVLVDSEFKLIDVNTIKTAKVIDYNICTIKNLDRPKHYNFGYIKYGQENLGQHNHVLCMIIDKEI